MFSLSNLLTPCQAYRTSLIAVFVYLSLHFDYCSSVWSNFSMHHSNELQILQNRLAHILLSADIRTSVDKMLKDLDWVRLTHRLDHHLLILRGATRMARGGIRLVHGLTKSTLITYFSGMKKDPKYMFLHAFCLSCSFQNLSIWPKTHPFFQFCTFLHP